MQNSTQKLVEMAKEEVEVVAVESRITVNSQPTFNQAKSQLIKLKTIKKDVQEKKDSIVKPLNTALKNTRELFKPIEEKIEIIETYLNSQLLKYNQKLIAEQKKREEEAVKKVEEAEKKGEKVDIEKITQRIEKVSEKIDQIKTRKIKKLKITDVNLIPRTYLIPDEAKIKQALLSGLKVDGAEIYEEEISINNY